MGVFVRFLNTEPSHFSFRWVQASDLQPWLWGDPGPLRRSALFLSKQLMVPHCLNACNVFAVNEAAIPNEQCHFQWKRA